MHECPTKLCLFISRYSRPPVRPEPPAIHEPSEILKGKTEVFIPAGKRDILWKLARMYKGEEQHVPSWSAFNAFITDKSPPVAAVRYMPFIRASPTDYSTIYTALIRLAQLSAQLGQKHILVTADLGIYNKAQEILWSNPPSLDGKVTMRLGGMHITMAYIASIGKLYGDAGLLSILIESDVYGENTARQLLQGKHLTRGELETHPRSSLPALLESDDVTDGATGTETAKAGTTEGCTTFLPRQRQTINKTPSQGHRRSAHR